MNTIRPFEVGTTVKWCDGERECECAGIVVEVCGQGNRVAEGDPVPSYVIRRPDLSEVSKTHGELVVV